MATKPARWMLAVALFAVGGILPGQEGAAGRESPEGEALFARHCAACHGKDGATETDVSRLLEPPPRDFGVGAFRLVTTRNGVPSDDDLARTIARGIPGTSMLGYAYLGDDAVDALVQHVRKLHRAGQRSRYRAVAAGARELEQWVRSSTTPGLTVTVPPATPDTVAARARGSLSFARFCVSCHGPRGRGSILYEKRTTEDGIAAPRDFTRGVLKGGGRDEDLFARIRCGMGGTPMPALTASELDDAGVWDIVHYLRTLVPTAAQALHTPAPARVKVTSVANGAAPSGPDDVRWKDVPETPVALAPVRDHNPGVPLVMVKALRDRDRMLLRLAWRDMMSSALMPEGSRMPDGIGVRITGSEPAFPPVSPTDRVVWLAGHRGGGVVPRSPERFFQLPAESPKAGTGTWSHGIWRVQIAVPLRVLKTPGAPLHLSLSAYDGAAGLAAPVSYSPWLRFEVR